MNRWECITCSFIYLEGWGGRLRYIPKLTGYESLDTDWICPECGVTKNDWPPNWKTK